MKTVIFLFVLVPIFLFDEANYNTRLNVKSYPIDWKKTKDWRLYYIRSKKGFLFSSDTLKNFKSVRMDQDSMKLFIATATEIPADRTPVWMGYYIASCRLPNDTLIKIEISQYGRFFYSDVEKRYYQLSDEMQDSWLAYLTAKWLVLEGATE
jgi:hypothetical protein